MIDNALLQKKSNYKELNLRQKTLLYIVVSVVFLLIILIWGGFMDKNSYGVDFTVRNNPPSLKHIFGTDWMGRDMLTRTIKGLSTSLIIGVVASLVSCVFAVIIGSACAIFGKKIDKFFLWLIDLFQGMPHLILLVLISILTGKAKRFIPQLFAAMSLCGVTPLIILWLMWKFGFAPAFLVALISAAIMIHWINQTEPESR